MGTSQVDREGSKVYEYVNEYVKQSSSFNREISIRPMALLLMEIEHADELVRRLHGGRRREVRERLQARALHVIAHAETAAHSGEIAVALRVRGSGLGTSWRRKIQIHPSPHRRRGRYRGRRPQPVIRSAR